MYWVTSRLGADRSVALVLGALAGAGAPMTIAHIVSSVKARGSYPTGIVGTHAVSDALATTTFAAVLPIALLLSDEAADVGSALFDFVQLGIGGAVLGLILGLFISRLGFQIETSGELLLFVLVHIVIGVDHRGMAGHLVAVGDAGCGSHGGDRVAAVVFGQDVPDHQDR